MIMNVEGLVAEHGFWALSTVDYEKICNGGGPKGWGWLIPDTMWGLSMTKAFDIHDYDYYIGTDKDVADLRMYKNCKALIDRRGGCFRRLRLMRLTLYYQAVSKLGGLFYNSKN
jgi:hypothetical protein